MLRSIFVFFILSINVCLADPLVVGVLNFPPYYILENQSSVSGGILVDMLEKILTKAGIDYTIKGLPPKRLYLELSEGTVHLWLGTKSVPEYEGKVLASPIPLTLIILELYSLKAKSEIPKTLKDLQNTSVILIRGYAYAGNSNLLTDSSKNITIHITNTHESAFNMLLAGRAEYVLDYSQPAIDIMKKKAISTVNSQSLSIVPAYLMVSTKVKDADKIMSKLMIAYSALKKEKAF